ncbi:hypothetical protein DAEQUDRAFT_397042 [Daedalea quercina L-15889]|uniref:Uncharacterized protein n=1 Tax=Daedalea quercina L-15889 TaxID=1314783 RepID=A0A165NTA4_9APHY|nr:hypothetical protein DAEQUDRAFT_397042 [Daedalea quercina L-15889]
MPRKKRPRSSDQDGRSDGHRRLPSRVPDSPMYVQWGGRPYGRMGGGPASVPTGLESEIDFSRPAGESNVDTEVSPVSPRPGSSSPNRPARAARGRRQRRSGVQNELSTSESVSPMTPSSESAGSWSPSTGISSAGRSNPSPLREHFSPSVQEHSPLRQQDSPTRRQRRPPDQQDLVFQPQRSPSAQTQRHGGYHPYPRTARRPVIAPQPRVPPGSVSSNSAMPQVGRVFPRSQRVCFKYRTGLKHFSTKLFSDNGGTGVVYIAQYTRPYTRPYPEYTHIFYQLRPSSRPKLCLLLHPKR